MHRLKTGLRTLLLTCLWPLPAFAVPAPTDVVMYEVNLRSFSEAGDLAGVTARLDNIQALGANTIWLMPIHPIGTTNMKGELGSPYSVADYGVVSSEYGNLSDLTDLIDQAHQRGMYVLMDWVANHTAWDHPWITAHPDWYTQDGSGNIVHPPGTNWTDVADLNYDNMAMRSAMIDEMTYWVSQVGIDGYRADAADWVPDDFWQQAVPSVRASTERDLLMLAEGGRINHYDAGFDLTFGWDLYGMVKNVFLHDWSATQLKVNHDWLHNQIPEGKSVLNFTTNHDESAWDATPVELFGSLEASLAAYAATVGYAGTPLVYASQEIGWEPNIPFFSKAPLDWDTGATTEQWYSNLLNARAQQPALRDGTITDYSTSDVAILQRELNGQSVLMLVNTRNQNQTVSIPGQWQGVWDDLLDGSSIVLSATRNLGPYEVLLIGTIPLPGDLNGDGYVGLDDLDLILNNWNQSVTIGDPLLGDVSGPSGNPDGYVGLDDLDVVLINWNAGTPPALNIPEPSVIATLSLLTIMGFNHRAQSRH